MEPTMRSNKVNQHWWERSRCPSVPVRLFIQLSSIIRTFVLSHRNLL